MDDDVILLSDDEDDKYLDELYLDLQNGGFNDENIEKAAALFRKLENDLMNEETNLLLLENWRDNQKLNNVQLKSGKVISCPNPTPKVSSNNNVPASTPNSTANNSSKYTKFMALQALEQQLLVKKSTLRKQLERSLDKITLPKPPLGNGLSDVAFVPSTVTNEFTALLGLDEIVHSIQTFELNGDKSSEQGRIFSPFACSKCKTDFTPVWKRKRPGSSEVVCESCIIESQRSGIHKTYYNQVSASLKQYASAEHEAEREYQDVVNNPVKLDAFTKEQERKLAANNPTPANQQQTQAIQQQSLVVNAQNQRYQTNYQQQAMHTANHRQAQTTTVNSAGASHLTNANVRRQPVPPTAPVVSSQPSQPQQQQLSLATQIAMQQLAAQYQQQQLSKNLASNSSNANLLLSANPLLSSGLAQHQLASMLAAQQQQQQRLSSVQQQQPSITDQLTQLQNLLLMISAANNNNQAASGANSNHAQNNSSSTGSGQQRSANNQPTNNSTLNQLFVNYSLYLQQQQQQQQAAAAAAAAAQAQQQQQASLALLQQLIGASGMANNSSSTTNVSTANNSNNNNNNTNLASYLALLQNVWATQSSQSNKK